MRLWCIYCRLGFEVTAVTAEYMCKLIRSESAMHDSDVALVRID